MIGRALVVVATLLAAVGALGLAVWLELDRASGTPVFLPVQSVNSDGDLVTLALDDVVQHHLDAYDDEPVEYLRLTVDAEGRVLEAARAALPPESGILVLRIRGGTIAPMSTRLPVGDHDAVRYLRLMVTPAGEGYEAGLADAELRLLGRADRLW